MDDVIAFSIQGGDRDVVDHFWGQKLVSHYGNRDVHGSRRRTARLVFPECVRGTSQVGGLLSRFLFDLLRMVTVQ